MLGRQCLENLGMPLHAGQVGRLQLRELDYPLPVSRLVNRPFPNFKVVSREFNLRLKTASTALILEPRSVLDVTKRAWRISRLCESSHDSLVAVFMWKVFKRQKTSSFG